MVNKIKPIRSKNKKKTRNYKKKTRNYKKKSKIIEKIIKINKEPRLF